MDFFRKAEVIRLRSHHDKYLLAEDDQETVSQDRDGGCNNARWMVEVVESEGVIRLISCYGKYLTASNMPFLLGTAGNRVVQSIPKRLDSSIEWEPLREGVQVRLKTRYGQFLRANGGLPPWRNSVTHDIPHRTSTQEWILWDVEVLKKASLPPPITKPVALLKDVLDEPESLPITSHVSPTYNRIESDDCFEVSAMKHEGRIIYYQVANENGNVDEGGEEKCFTFKGMGVKELKEKIEEEIGLVDVQVCSLNPLNGKLYPLRLHLPPNNATMHVVVTPCSQV